MMPSRCANCADTSLVERGLTPSPRFLSRNVNCRAAPSHPSSLPSFSTPPPPLRSFAAVVPETPIAAREGRVQLPFTYRQARERAAQFIHVQNGVLSVDVAALHALVKSMTRLSVDPWIQGYTVQSISKTIDRINT